MVSEAGNTPVFTPLDEVLAMTKELPADLMHLLHTVGQS